MGPLILCLCWVFLSEGLRSLLLEGGVLVVVVVVVVVPLEGRCWPMPLLLPMEAPRCWPMSPTTKGLQLADCWC